MATVTNVPILSDAEVLRNKFNVIEFHAIGNEV
jgi:hypothetical protein